jgi:hypothetical protein
MATEAVPAAPVHKHRRAMRKRIRARSPISGRLLLDNHLRGDTAVLSDDLVTDLFPNVNLTGKNMWWWHSHDISLTLSYRSRTEQRPRPRDPIYCDISVYTTIPFYRRRPMDYYTCSSTTHRAVASRPDLAFYRALPGLGKLSTIVLPDLRQARSDSPCYTIVTTLGNSGLKCLASPS